MSYVRLKYCNKMLQVFRIYPISLKIPFFIFFWFLICNCLNCMRNYVSVSLDLQFFHDDHRHRTGADMTRYTQGKGIHDDLMPRVYGLNLFLPGCGFLFAAGVSAGDHGLFRGEAFLYAPAQQCACLAAHLAFELFFGRCRKGVIADSKQGTV